MIWQDGATRRYHHEDARWPQAVTGITDEAGVRYGTWGAAQQRAAGSIRRIRQPHVDRRKRFGLRHFHQPLARQFE
jgi:hypothetical protein